MTDYTGSKLYPTMILTINQGVISCSQENSKSHGLANMLKEVAQISMAPKITDSNLGKKN
jgi:hypothetical protein